MVENRPLQRESNETLRKIGSTILHIEPFREVAGDQLVFRRVFRG
jgi:hypothetical protein